MEFRRNRHADARPVSMATESSRAYVREKPCPLNDIRTLIEKDANLAQYNIISLRAFVMPWATAIRRGVAPHRFLLLELRLADEKLWLRLERRPDSKIALLRGFGSTTTKDEVYLKLFVIVRGNIPTLLSLGSISQPQSRNLVQGGISPRE
jgi:hypothetical protein